MDKVVVITGSSSGIGAALADRLTACGASVVLVARRAAALEEVAKRGRKSFPIVADVTRRADVRRVVDEVLKRFGRIDVWVNNAGQGITRQPSELTDEDVDAMISANVKSALYGMQETLPHFKSRGEGHIVNISSMLGRIPDVPHRSAYSAAKHFLNAMTTMFRDEIQQAYPNIRVSLVSPGIVRTEFGLNARHGGADSRQLPNSQTPEEVAGVIADVIESRKPDVYTRRGARDRVAAHYASIGEDPT
jgi:NAD(P)-dependent dehydrogenase (short-subunit alcohol dehydrogenase family)